MTGPAIPASAIVAVTPSVLSAGGTALDLVGLLLTQNSRVPIGDVLRFTTQADVAGYFGATSQEAQLATNYFLGFDNSNVKPASMLFTQYNTVAVGAWLRGASISGMTIAQLQATPPGTMAVRLDGNVVTSNTINLATATSFSQAAAIMSTALGQPAAGGATFTASISGFTMTVTAVSAGTLAVGQVLTGGGTTPGTVIAAYGTGIGGVGTYILNNSQTIASTSLSTSTPTVTYDAITASFVVTSSTTGANSSIDYATGTIANVFHLTQASGAQLSQGAIPATALGVMSNVVATTQDWVSFATAFDPDGGSGNAQKLALAQWCNGQGNRYVYVAWDTDIGATQQNNSTCLGQLIEAANLSGTVALYSPTQGAALASFFMGAIASIDFTELNGRTTLAFRSQTGLVADITNATIASTLEGNGYNYYGVWSTANDRFTFAYSGSIGGPFAWIDSYIDQVWMNNQFQLALMVLLTSRKSIPYNMQGYGQIKAACQDVINQAVDFGAVRAGVTLSMQQAASVNADAGVRIDDILGQRGWYFQVRDALPQVRAARGSPPCTFWYMDGQSVQRINLASVMIQ